MVPQLSPLSRKRSSGAPPAVATGVADDFSMHPRSHSLQHIGPHPGCETGMAHATETVQDCAGVLIRVHSQPQGLNKAAYGTAPLPQHDSGIFSLTSCASGIDSEDEGAQDSTGGPTVPTVRGESPRPGPSHCEFRYHIGGTRGGPGGQQKEAPGAGGSPHSSPWCLDWLDMSGTGSPPDTRSGFDDGLADVKMAWEGGGHHGTEAPASAGAAPFAGEATAGGEGQAADWDDDLMFSGEDSRCLFTGGALHAASFVPPAKVKHEA